MGQTIRLTETQLRNMIKESIKETMNYIHSNTADYDLGDGKIGNYAVPQHLVINARTLYNRLKNNRHYHITHGLPEKEIMEMLNSHEGDVKISQHKNGDGIEIYRLEFY